MWTMPWEENIKITEIAQTKVWEMLIQDNIDLCPSKVVKKCCYPAQ